MSVEPAEESKPSKKKQKSTKPQLRIVLDTNALYVPSSGVGSPSDLVRQEIASLIADSKYPDLEIIWYLPEIVRHERQYQMQTEALRLRSAIDRIERLLGHKLALTDEVLLDHVEKRIDEKETELGLTELPIDHGLVDWSSVMRAAVYRTPPFQPGEKEKGFRDALIVESFLQLLSKSPKTPSVCRVVLVTADGLLAQAVRDRLGDSSNASILPGIEDLKGLINTIVSNVGADVIAQLKTKASKLFFIDKDQKDTLFYKEEIRKTIETKFATELERRPEGTAFRQNGVWVINHPNFSRKEGRRVFWTTRIDVEMEAGITTNESEFSGRTPELFVPSGPQTLGKITINTPSTLASIGGAFVPVTTTGYTSVVNIPSLKRTVTVKGRDVFEVLWSAEMTMAKDLKKARIEEIRHVELMPQPVAQPVS